MPQNARFGQAVKLILDVLGSLPGEPLKFALALVDGKETDAIYFNWHVVDNDKRFSRHLRDAREAASRWKRTNGLHAQFYAHVNGLGQLGNAFIAAVALVAMQFQIFEVGVTSQGDSVSIEINVTNRFTVINAIAKRVSPLIQVDKLACSISTGNWTVYFVNFDDK